MEETPKTHREKLIPFWFVLAFGACLTLLTEVLRREYNSALGRVAIKPGATILMAIGLLLGLYLINVLTKRNDLVWFEPSGDEAAEIKNGLMARGLGEVKIRVFSRGGPNLPKLESGIIRLSTNCFESLSPAAIVWHVASEAELQNKLLLNPEAMILVIFSLGFNGIAFMVKLKVHSAWCVLSAFLMIYGVIYFAGLRNRVLRMTDRALTNFPRDYSAAKELLSYAYFRTHNEIKLAWIPGLENEFLTRAKYLGIELERSYRVLAGDNIEGRA